MRSPYRAGLLFFSATLFFAPEAFAGNWPSEYYSQTPNLVTACPAGDMEFAFTLHDFMNRPLRNNLVTLALNHCPLELAPVLGDEGYQVDYSYGADYPLLSLLSDDAARVRFAIRGGGTCAARGAIIYINGALWYRALASPDQDDNLSVGPEDVAIATAKLGSSDPTADFDGDGTVTAADLDILRGHLGHQAPSQSTPVASPSWGTLKLLYR